LSLFYAKILSCRLKKSFRFFEKNINAVCKARSTVFENPALFAKNLLKKSKAAFFSCRIVAVKSFLRLYINKAHSCIKNKGFK